MKTIHLVICLLLSSILSAQSIPAPSLMKALAPRNIGPAGMSGRVTAIDVDLSNDDIIYVGTASGGVWKSNNGGIDWKPIFDDQPLMSIGAIAVNQKNTDEIWVGTGEGNPRNSHNTGGGLFRSRDGGASWELVGLEATQNIHRIIIHRDKPDVVYVGAMGSIWGPHPERGVFRTQDGGDHWEHILSMGDGVGIGDLVVDPTNPEKLLAAMWEFDRDPWFFTSGGSQSGLFISYDGGDSWQQKNSEDGLPKGDLGRMGLAISPSQPNIIYALIEAKVNGLYKSIDGGKKWSLVSEKNIGNRPFYYADIFVDPVNENRIYNLWSYVSLSEDGGKTFKTIMDYSTNVHPDHHAFWVHPNDPSYLIEGNDGGLNISRDRGKTWRFVTNIPVAQFYHINYDMDIPYHIGGGMQDNGSWVGPSQVWKHGGITNANWQEVLFGDGFDLCFHPDDSRFVFAMSQGGYLNKVDRTTGARRLIRPVHPDGEWLRFNWNAAIAADPLNKNGLYFGSQYVHKSTDNGQSWTIISPDLTTNDPEKQKADSSGGLTFDATQAENYTTIVAIAPDWEDENTIWVGTDDGKLQITRNGGQTWQNLADKLPNMPKGSWIPYIELSKTNAGEAFVIVNDYRRNNFKPMAFHTTDYGQSWASILKGDQVKGYTRCIVQDPEAPALLFLGTDRGLFYSVDYGENWTQWTEGFPSVPVADLKIHPREQDLIIGTFGRSAWIMDDIRPLQTVANSEENLFEKNFCVFPAPDAYKAHYRSYEGIRFIADAEFVGKNRAYGALLTVWVKAVNKADVGSKKPPKRDKDVTEKKKKQGTKIQIKILNSQGDTIRSFSKKAEEGFNRFSWDLREDGVYFPSRSVPKPDADPPAGGAVVPGVYKVVMTYGTHKDSTNVHVKADPRVVYAPNTWDNRAVARQEWNQITEAATNGFNTLQDIRKTIKRVNQSIVNAPDSIQTEIKELGKSLQDSIVSLELLFMEAKKVKGIKRNPLDLTSTLNTARSYMGYINGAPSQMFELSMNKARKQTSTILEKMNTFIEQDFKPYQEKVENVDFSLFKALGVLKIE